MPPERRVIITIEQTYEIPVDEEKVRRLFAEALADPSAIEDDALTRGIERMVEEGDISLRRLPEVMGDESDPEVNRLPEYGVTVEVEKRCPRHPDRWAFLNVNPDKPLYCGKCLMERHPGER